MKCASSHLPVLVFVSLLPLAQGQDANTRNRAVANPVANAPDQPKRIFWIIPNHRSSPSMAHYQPLTPGEKANIALRDSIDPGTFLLAGLFAGQGQLSNSNPSFGQGAAGYGRYFGTAYGDLAIGDWMTEAIFPILLHQDPRYFRRGTGTTGSRLLYAVKQIVWTHSDSGHREFNYSEIFGNATAAGISNAYYPDNRSAGQTAQRFGTQIGLDAAGNILKEFWPDLYDKFGHKHHH